MKETPYVGYTEQELSLVRQISRAVHTMSRVTWWESQCLVKAVAAMKMLERRGIPSTLYLGSGRDDQGQMAAHAWLRSGSYIVTGKEGHERYAVVGIFGKDTRAGDLNLKRSSDKEFYIEGSLYFIRKMRGMAGFKLYLNMGMILVISVLDGIGIYLIVPLRGHWRIRDRFERGAARLNLDGPCRFMVIAAQFADGAGPLCCDCWRAGLAAAQPEPVKCKILQASFVNCAWKRIRGCCMPNGNFSCATAGRILTVMTNELGRVNQGTFLFLQMISSFCSRLFRSGLPYGWLRC